MDDLISRQAAIEIADAIWMVTGDKNVAKVWDQIKDLPSAQPHITHCAECIHWQHSAVRKSYCEVFDWMNEAEDFCSFAERRTDEQAD